MFSPPSPSSDSTPLSPGETPSRPGQAMPGGCPTPGQPPRRPRKRRGAQSARGTTPGATNHAPNPPPTTPQPPLDAEDWIAHRAREIWWAELSPEAIRPRPGEAFPFFHRPLALDGRYVAEALGEMGDDLLEAWFNQASGLTAEPMHVDIMDFIETYWMHWCTAQAQDEWAAGAAGPGQDSW